MKCQFQSTESWNHVQIKVMPGHCLIHKKFYWYIHSTTTIIPFNGGEQGGKKNSVQ